MKPLNRRTTLASALALGLSVTALAAAGCGTGAASAHQSAEEGPLRCEIAVTRSGGSLTYQARVHADEPAEGGYRLTIHRSGASGAALINQSGRFSAAPGRPAELGRATLGGDPAQYRATLELDWQGRTLTCSDTRGSAEL